MTSDKGTQTQDIVDHFFRHEYGRVLSYLTRKFGSDHFELVEDAVQESLFKAMQAWPFSGVPSNPSGWITKTAQNKLIDDLRRVQRFDQKTLTIVEEAEKQQLPDEIILENELRDDLLKMMFACCRDEISEEYQIILALKILCGFGNKEIALALFKSEDAVAKGYLRAKEKLREEGFVSAVPSGDELKHRLDNLLQIIYLLFNEGYKATHGTHLIKKDLCFEAIRLTQHVLEHPGLATPEAMSLMALMLFQASRFDCRVSKEGKLQTLKEQDRSLWDKSLIDRGIQYLDKATEYNQLSEYYLQASIAAVHCLAPDFKSTSWDTILSLYSLLQTISANKIVALNRIVALGRVQGFDVAMDELSKLEDDQMTNFYLFHAIKADLLHEMGNHTEAKRAYLAASALADNKLEQEYLMGVANSLAD